MGTSSIFGGKKDKSSLFPTDYNPEGDNKIASWKGLKTETSRYVSSNGHYSDARRIVRDYVRASGGTVALVGSSGSGIRAAGNIGSFFYGVAQNGVADTLRKIGIDYQGQGVNEVFSRLVDVFSENANTKDDGVARRAVQEALVSVYDYVEINDMDISCLDKMPVELMNSALKNFMTEYIWATVLKDLESRIEDKMVDVASAKQCEEEIKGVIESVVTIEFGEGKNIINKNVRNAVKELTKQCYEVLEGTI